MPFHTEPLPDFRNEWWAGAFGLAATIAGGMAMRRGEVLSLPRVVAIPALLLLVMLLQYGLGLLAFPQVGLLHAAYLLWAAALMILGRFLADTLGIERLAEVLACALLLGASIGAAIALAQWAGLAGGSGWIFPRIGGASYGNLAQANNFADYSWLGIASALHLRARALLGRPLLWLLLLLIAFGGVLSGSRSVFIYALILIAVAGWARFRHPSARLELPWADVLLLLPALIGLSLLAGWATPRLAAWQESLGVLAAAHPSATAGSRLYESVAGSSARLEIARAAWTAFLQHPWLGQGVGNYSWASFLAASGEGGDTPFMVAEHAHNFILQLLAEFGAPATALVLLVLAFWGRDCLRGSWGPARFWCAAVAGIVAVHSLLEYPLWYAFFLGPAALLLGAADGRTMAVLPARRTAVYLVLVALGGMVILAGLRRDHAIIEQALHAPLAAHPEREQAWRMTMDRLLTLQRESLLSPWAMLAFASLSQPSREQAPQRAALCERGIRFAPGRRLLTRCAMQLAIAGRQRDAGDLTLRILAAFPAQRGASLDELARGSRKHPEIAPLLELAAARHQHGIGPVSPPAGEPR